MKIFIDLYMYLFNLPISKAAWNIQ